MTPKPAYPPASCSKGHSHECPLLRAEPYGAACIATDLWREDLAERSLHRELEGLRRRSGTLLGNLGYDVLAARAAELRAGVTHSGREIPGAILIEAPSCIDDPGLKLGIESAAPR